MAKILYLKVRADHFRRITCSREPKQYGIALLPTLLYFNGWNNGWHISLWFLTTRISIEKTYFISKSEKK